MRNPDHGSRTGVLAAALAGAVLAGCGAETATTAATGAAIKKSEIEQGEKTRARAEQRVEQAAQRLQERAEESRASSDR